MIRYDLSSKLIHLTKGKFFEDAADTLEKILYEKELIGGNGCIRGGFNCVCFSEAPLNALAQLVASRINHSFRYKPFGVIVEKEWLFKKADDQQFTSQMMNMICFLNSLNTVMYVLNSILGILKELILPGKENGVFAQIGLD